MRCFAWPLTTSTYSMSTVREDRNCCFDNPALTLVLSVHTNQSPACPYWFWSSSRWWILRRVSKKKKNAQFGVGRSHICTLRLNICGRASGLWRRGFTLLPDISHSSTFQWRCIVSDSSFDSLPIIRSAKSSPVHTTLGLSTTVRCCFDEKTIQLGLTGLGKTCRVFFSIETGS